MKYTLKINSIKSVDELEGSWNKADFVELLSRFDYADADKLKQNELKDFLFMAISDFEPDEAATIVLDYKLSEVLTEGQIDNLSHEMTREKVSENYSEISIHKILFDINQLLYKAYNGKFPKAIANVIDFEMRAENDEEITKAIVLQSFAIGLSDRNLIIRIFKEHLEGKVPFPEAEGILWNLESKGNAQYRVTTSEKWLKKEDFTNMEFECDVTPFIGKSEEE
ncbi:MAG TPA: hypothetical protein VFC67_14255 [Prolixibacteraceae bacterium]|nr:hypothetical protein [Prolixibacteraceae bacterium]